MKREGNYGKEFNDRVLSAEVRTLTLNEIKKVLKKGKGSLYGAVLVKMAGTILPRLNELSGEGGQPLIIEISGAVAKKHAANTSTRANS